MTTSELPNLNKGQIERLEDHEKDKTGFFWFCRESMVGFGSEAPEKISTDLESKMNRMLKKIIKKCGNENNVDKKILGVFTVSYSTIPHGFLVSPTNLRLPQPNQLPENLEEFFCLIHYHSNSKAEEMQVICPFKYDRKAKNREMLDLLQMT